MHDFSLCAGRVIDESDFVLILLQHFFQSVIAQSFAAEIGNRISIRKSNPSPLSNWEVCQPVTATPRRSDDRSYNIALMELDDVNFYAGRVIGRYMLFSSYCSISLVSSHLQILFSSYSSISLVSNHRQFCGCRGLTKGSGSIPGRRSYLRSRP